MVADQYEKMRLFQEACDCYSTLLFVVNQAKDKAEVFFKRGELKIKMSQKEDAKLDLEQALELKPDHMGAAMLLSNYFSNAGNKRAALEVITKSKA